MEPQNPGTNTNPSPITPPSRDPVAPAPVPNAMPAAQPAPQPAPPNVTPTAATQAPTTPEPVVPAPIPTSVVPQAVTPAPAPEFPTQPAMPETTAPQSPQLSQPVVSGAGAYPMVSESAQAAGRAKKFKLIGIGIIAAAILLLGVGGYVAYTSLTAGLKLKEYKGDGYALLVPTDYKEETDREIVVFKEDDEEATESSLRVTSWTYPSAPTDEETEGLIEFFKESLREGLSVYTDGGEIKNLNIADTTHKGHKAIKATADAEENGKYVRKIVVVFAFTQKGYYGLILMVHHEDTGLDKKVDKIIESFEVE